MLKYIFNYVLSFSILFLLSCQKVEILDDIVFDYNQLPKIIISAEKSKVNEIYQTQFIDPYLDHSLDIPPLRHFNNWITNNFETIGVENDFNINIINASLTKIIINNNEAKKYEEKTIFKYEIIFLVEYILYDNNNNILAKTLVESKNSITSGKFISLFDTERIIDSLILDGLKDFTEKSNELLKTHMYQYIL